MYTQSIQSQMVAQINHLIVRQQNRLAQFSACVEICHQAEIKNQHQFAQMQVQNKLQSPRIRGWEMDEYREYMKCS